MSACSGWPRRCGSRASTRVPPSDRAGDDQRRRRPTRPARSCRAGRGAAGREVGSPVTCPARRRAPGARTRRLLASRPRPAPAPACLTHVRQRLADDPHQDPADDRRGLARRPGRRPRRRAARRRTPTGRARAAPPRRPPRSPAGIELDQQPPEPAGGFPHRLVEGLELGGALRRQHGSSERRSDCSRMLTAAITWTVSSWMSPAIRCRSASWASCRCSSRPRWWATWRCIARGRRRPRAGPTGRWRAPSGLRSPGR